MLSLLTSKHPIHSGVFLSHNYSRRQLHYRNRKNFVVNHFAQSDEIFLCENFFTSITIYGEYMAHIDMNKNIVT